MNIKIGRLYINYIFIAVVAFFIIVDSVKFVFLLFLAAFIHESAHLAAGLFFKLKIKNIYLNPFGIRIDFLGMERISYACEIIIAAAGPLSNLFCAAVSFGAIFIFGFYDGIGFWIFANLALAVLNLFPIKALDGGRILSGALLLRLNPFEADMVCRNVELVFFIILCGAALFFIAQSGFNISLLLIALYIGAMIILGNSSRISFIER